MIIAVKSKLHQKSLFQFPLWLQITISLVSVSLVAICSYPAKHFLDYRVIGFLLLITVSLLAISLQIGPVLIGAISSALLWDFFYIPPTFNFTIGNTADRILLGMYFIIASVNAVLTAKIRNYEKDIQKKEEKERTLHLYSHVFNSLSHELRTPIATILTGTDTLRDPALQHKLTEAQKEIMLQEISSAALRLNDQVSNLLNMSRLEAGQLQLKPDWCDISELTYKVIDNLQNLSEEHLIEVNIPKDIPLVKLDFGLIEQVIENLLRNALMHTPAGTTINIEIKCEEGEPSQLKIVTYDNGPGFNESEIAHAFDKFISVIKNKPGGTGLGLSIVKGFVQAHNGQIELINRPAGGAQFTILIPVSTSYLNALKNE